MINWINWQIPVDDDDGLGYKELLTHPLSSSAWQSLSSTFYVFIDEEESSLLRCSHNGLSYIATHARCKYPLAEWAERRAGEGCEIKIPFLLSREHEKIKLANPIPSRNLITGRAGASPWWQLCLFCATIWKVIKSAANSWFHFVLLFFYDS